MSDSVLILSSASALPPHNVEQSKIRDFAAAVFGGKFSDLDRLLPVFEHSQIQSRQLSKPLEWFHSPHSFREANEAYCTSALELSSQAAAEAIRRAGLSPQDIESMVFVSNTGISTPALDAALIQKIGMSPNVSRLPVWGLGCAGGVSGLSHAARLCRANRGLPTMLVSVELCSLTFQHNDYSKSNLIAASLFGDGAAAVILTGADFLKEKNGSIPEGKYLELLEGHSTLMPDSSDIMGWDLTDTGLKVRFSRDIPAIVRTLLPGILENACEKWKIPRNSVRRYIMHPGGAKVLDAYRDALKIEENDLRFAYQCLKEHGNLSSASVLLVLEMHLRESRGSGDYGIFSALGPGFSSEMLLFRW